MSFALLEGVMRFYYSTFGSSEDRIRYLMTADEIARLPRSILPLPGVEYGLTPGFGDISVLGWRGDDVVLPKPQGVFRIVAMGASTTYGFTATEETYPAWLERILHETYGLNNVEVVNAGVSGYTTWNSMVSLATRVLELEPDLVIVYHATNDVLARDVEPECYRGHNPLRGLDPRMYMSGVQLISLSPSVLLRFLDLQTGRVVDPLRIDSILQPPPYECAPGINVANASPQVAHDTERIRANPPVYFERNLRTMIGIARIHNIQFMLPTWAYWEATTEPGVYWREAIAEHNSIIRQLVREYDLLSVDYAETAPQEQEYWSDYIHMNSDGSRHQAQTFADYLVEQDVFGADVSAGAGSG
jgi:lysophospholipase L1-like esterase